jgi:hypothetical protein
VFAFASSGITGAVGVGLTEDVGELDEDGVEVGPAFGSPPHPASARSSATATTRRAMHDPFRPE